MLANAIDTTKFVLKIYYDTDKSILKKKIKDTYNKMPDTSGLVNKQIITQKLLK